MSELSLDELQDHLSLAAEARSRDRDLTFKPLFGGVCAYIEGRVFASLSNVGLALKLPPDAQAELLAEAGAKRLQYEPDAPPSKQYIVVPPPMPGEAAVLGAWLERSMDYVLSLPAPKSKNKSNSKSNNKSKPKETA